MEPISFAFTPETIAAVVGLVLMLVFAYFPGLRVKYAGLASEVKSYIMVGLLTLSAAVIWVLTIYGFIVTTEPITLTTFIEIVLALLVSNQPTYSIAPEAKDVKAAIAERDAGLL